MSILETMMRQAEIEQLAQEDFIKQMHRMRDSNKNRLSEEDKIEEARQSNFENIGSQLKEYENLFE